MKQEYTPLEIRRATDIRLTHRKGNLICLPIEPVSGLGYKAYATYLRLTGSRLDMPHRYQLHVILPSCIDGRGYKDFPCDDGRHIIHLGPMSWDLTDYRNKEDCGVWRLCYNACLRVVWRTIDGEAVDPNELLPYARCISLQAINCLGRLLYDIELTPHPTIFTSRIV